MEVENILPAKEAEQRPEYIGIRWLERTWQNKMLYLVYRILSIINNSAWYYFAPIIANQIFKMHFIVINYRLLRSDSE